MKKKIFLILILGLSFAWPSFAEQEDSDKDEPLYQQLSRAIIRLENNQGKPVGTAFFTTYDGDLKHYYLITARHVAFPPQYLHSRVPSQNRETGSDH